MTKNCTRGNAERNNIRLSPASRVTETSLKFPQPLPPGNPSHLNLLSHTFSRKAQHLQERSGQVCSQPVFRDQTNLRSRRVRWQVWRYLTQRCCCSVPPGSSAIEARGGFAISKSVSPLHALLITHPPSSGSFSFLVFIYLFGCSGSQLQHAGCLVAACYLLVAARGI